MDPQRFDTLVKSLSGSGTRRGIVRLLAALPLGVTLTTVLGQEEADAERPLDRVRRRAQNRQQRRHSRNDGGTNHDKDKGHDKDHKREGKTRNPDCRPKCAGKACGARNGCGGICHCPKGQDCLPQGVCATPCRDNPNVCTGTVCTACYPAQNGQSYCAESQFVDSCDAAGTCQFPGGLCVVGFDLCAVICNP